MVLPTGATRGWLAAQITLAASPAHTGRGRSKGNCSPTTRHCNALRARTFMVSFVHGAGPALLALPRQANDCVPRLWREWNEGPVWLRCRLIQALQPNVLGAPIHLCRPSVGRGTVYCVLKSKLPFNLVSAVMHAPSSQCPFLMTAAPTAAITPQSTQVCCCFF